MIQPAKSTLSVGRRKKTCHGRKDGVPPTPTPLASKNRRGWGILLHETLPRHQRFYPQATPACFLRPRRFGRSLWLSPLSYYYGRGLNSLLITHSSQDHSATRREISAYSQVNPVTFPRWLVDPSYSFKLFITILTRDHHE